MLKDVIRMLEDIALGPQKKQVKESMIEQMDLCASQLVGTRILGEKLNIFDSETYSAILNQMAEKHYNATRGMSPDEILAYMKDSVEAKKS